MPVFFFIDGSFETAAWRIGWRKMMSSIAASSFQTILRPAACFLRTRTIVPISCKSNKMPMTQPYKPAAAAADATPSQSLVQISEP